MNQLGSQLSHILRTSLNPEFCLVGLAALALLSILLIIKYSRQYKLLHHRWLHDLEQCLEYKTRNEHLNLRLTSLEHTKTALEQNNIELIRTNAELNAALQQQKDLNAKLEQHENRLNEAFKSLSYQALHQNSESFIQMAKLNFDKTQSVLQQDIEHKHKSLEQLIAPLCDSLKLFDNKINDIESQRLNSYELLKHQIQELNSTQITLRNETAKLVGALRSSNIRGRWGEIQLRRVVELAGMLNYCDFIEQPTLVDQDDNKRYRPDMIVKLPGEKQIVIDAKTPINSYLSAHETDDDEQRTRLLQEHAKQLRLHIQALSNRSYWQQYANSPEFVILFLPGDVFFSAALSADPTLIEFGAEHKVYVTTPTSLITLLRTVALSWNQQQLSANISTMTELGRSISNYLRNMLNDLSKVGRNLNLATENYNSVIRSIQSKLLPTTEKLDQLQNSNDSKNIVQLSVVNNTARNSEIL